MPRRDKPLLKYCDFGCCLSCKPQLSKVHVVATASICVSEATPFFRSRKCFVLLQKAKGLRFALFAQSEIIIYYKRVALIIYASRK